jgi:hypothetical protein
MRTKPAGSPRGETSSPPPGRSCRDDDERRPFDELPCQRVKPVGDLLPDELRRLA